MVLLRIHYASCCRISTHLGTGLATLSLLMPATQQIYKAIAPRKSSHMHVDLHVELLLLKQALSASALGDMHAQYAYDLLCTYAFYIAEKRYNTGTLSYCSIR